MPGFLSGLLKQDKEALANPDNWDIGGMIRYGMPTNEKEALASAGRIPGHPDTKDNPILQRDASGYMVGKNWGSSPYIARAGVGLGNILHRVPAMVGSVIGKDWDDSEIQKYASPAVERGIEDYEKEGDLEEEYTDRKTRQRDLQRGKEVIQEEGSLRNLLQGSGQEALGRGKPGLLSSLLRR